MSQRDPLMDQEFFTNLPSEIVIDILSRLSVRSIIICKCVCKTWLDVLGAHDFAKLHFSRSVPSLAVGLKVKGSQFYDWFDFEDDPYLEHHELHYKLVTEFDSPNYAALQGSANGLILLGNSKPYGEPNSIYICNPVTRDYIKLKCPEEESAYSYPIFATFGFGASVMTGEYKVVRISQYCICDKETHEIIRFTKSQCYVYTLGTGSWRHIAPGESSVFGWSPAGTFVNGNLHWLDDPDGLKNLISCFDLETELFSPFPRPPLPDDRDFYGHLSTLGDCLSFSVSAYGDDGIHIWLMKEYGVEKSWTKEFVISSDLLGLFNEVYPIKVFKNGDIFMLCDGVTLLCYSTKTKATRRMDAFKHYYHDVIEAILHTPSFLSLESLGFCGFRNVN